MKDELFTAVVGDVLDAAGYTHQFLPAADQSARSGDAGWSGRAMPVLEADCYGDQIASNGERQPFGLMFEALDALQANEVYICTGSSPTYALWGELMSTRAIKLGAAGAVLDGYHRDTRGILRLGFPTFSFGSYAQDQRVRGRVIDYRCPIQFANGVVVQPGRHRLRRHRRRGDRPARAGKRDSFRRRSTRCTAKTACGRRLRRACPPSKLSAASALCETLITVN